MDKKISQREKDFTTLESYGAEPEIVEKIKQVLLDYYTEKVARLEKEFTNL